MRPISVAFVLLSLAVAFGRLATAQSVAATRSHPRTQVVFVCEHGSVKSLVAMEYFNRRSKARLTLSSRGAGHCTGAYGAGSGSGRAARGRIRRLRVRATVVEL